MSAIVGSASGNRSGTTTGCAIIAALGVGALLARTQLTSLPPWGRSLALAAVTGSILLASLVVPVPADRDVSRRRVSSPIALTVGLLAIAAAAIVSGRPASLPFVAWAVPLSVLAAVAEEALFRRVAYGWLSRWGVAVAVLGSALLFAVIHVPLYGVAVLPVDLGAGLLLSWQRWATGTWAVPAATHATANVLATVLR